MQSKCHVKKEKKNSEIAIDNVYNLAKQRDADALINML